MPCRDDPVERDCSYERGQISRLDRELSLMKAYACAALRVLERDYGDQMYRQIDSKEGGFEPSPLQAWFEVHKAEDEQRRVRERQIQIEQERLSKLRVNALSKLTPEEKAVLGLK